LSNNIQKLIKRSSHSEFIREVFDFSKEYYKDKKIPWGEDYISHVTDVALILSDMHLDYRTVAAGILHDILEVSDLPKEKMIHTIKNNFGEDIAQIVENFSEVKRIYFSFDINEVNEFLAKEKVENLRRMFFAISKDLRVVLIELAARIDRLNKIKNAPQEKQKLYATETLQVFVPIANRLGLGNIKTKLEDMAFACLFPEEFKWIENNLKLKYEERQKFLNKFIPHLKKIFKQEKIRFLDINYRAKSYWSTYQKIASKYSMDIDRVHDLVALRVIVPDISMCYRALGIIHKYYKPISEEIDDYIAKPKPNGYKSLHTTVFLQEDTISEIQIRTLQMQEEAEYGICAHWSYKEKLDLQKDKEKMSWSREIPEFLKNFKIDFFKDQVFVFTPKRDILSLPKGSTPVDFAYAIHSNIGDHIDSAKVKGKIVPLSQILDNGDIVEIVINKNRKPSRDWLNFVKTASARSHIKKSIEIKIPPRILSIPFFIKSKLSEISEAVKKKRKEVKKVKKEGVSQIYLAGQKGMMVSIAKCCLPKAGDTSKAYITKNRAAVLHKITCPNLKKLSEKFPERIIDASWK